MEGVRRAASISLLLTALIVVAGASEAAAAPRANVVVIVTDDQTLEAFNERTMPRTVKRLAGRGTTFSEAIVATPQCCPSRAGLLTGQYQQNNGVSSNRPGYPSLIDKRDVLPSWLQSAGYRTIHVGKYLNGYYAAEKAKPAPGWDRWQTVLSTDYQQPVFSRDGRLIPSDRYLTTELTETARRLIGRYATSRRPFYLQLDHLAPHVGSGGEVSRCRGAAVPAPADEHLFEGVMAPRTPAVEDDVGDKPEFIRRLAPLDGEQLRHIDEHYGCALASLREVDRGLATLLGALRQAGELRRTMVVFTSDNGYSYTEHRVELTKGLPYEEYVRVPFVIKPPAGFPRRFRSGATVAAPVANIDLAPTILDLAGADSCRRGPDTCRRMDGRSLLPLLEGREPRWSERRAIRTGFAINAPSYRRSCTWDGLRTPEQVLVNHVLLPAGGEPFGFGSAFCEPADVYEYYDLEADPFQLRGDAPIPAGLADRLDSLRRCSGIRGRDERLESVPFCE